MWWWEDSSTYSWHGGSSLGSHQLLLADLTHLLRRKARLVGWGEIERGLEKVDQN